MPVHIEASAAIGDISESENMPQNDDSVIPEAIAPEVSLALTVVTTPLVSASTRQPESRPSPATPSASASACPSESRPSPGTPSSFDLSKEYGVSMIRNSILTILKESPTQVLERGGDFAGIKAVLEPLLDVMENLSNAAATLPYRTLLVQMEALFHKWESQRGQPLHSMIEDRVMQLVRTRDDTQFELERQILEKKQAVQQLGEMTRALFNENKRAADIERNQKLLVESHKAALLDIQAKLAKAENELKAATERHQTLEAQWTAHQATVQAESDDLEQLSVAVSQMPVLSDDDLRRQAMEEVKAAHREAINATVAEIRQAVARL